jgi:hypothetical protein
MMPGTRLRRLAARLCSQRAMEFSIDPVIADLQHEYEQTTPGARRLIVLADGYFGFWKVLAVHAPAAWLQRTLRPFARADARMAIGALASAALSLTLVTVALMAAPVAAMAGREILGPWLLTLLVPQSLPFSIPLTLFAGVVSAISGRRVTTMIRRAVVLVGLAGVLASFSTIVWLVPAANQAFRETIARSTVLKGGAEMSPQELRNQALTLKAQGHAERAGELLFSYHARWAIVGAPLPFAWFALGLTARHLRRISTFASGLAACVVYVLYFFELHVVGSSMFTNEWIAFAVAWLPNLCIVGTSAALLSAAPERPTPDCA